VPLKAFLILYNEGFGIPFFSGYIFPAGWLDWLWACDAKLHWCAFSGVAGRRLVTYVHLVGGCRLGSLGFLLGFPVINEVGAKPV